MSLYEILTTNNSGAKIPQFKKVLVKLYNAYNDMVLFKNKNTSFSLIVNWNYSK